MRLPEPALRCDVIGAQGVIDGTAAESYPAMPDFLAKTGTHRWKVWPRRRPRTSPCRARSSCRTRRPRWAGTKAIVSAPRRSQAVIAHTNVGLANCAIGAINVAVERISILLFSGRTPTTERDRFETRTVPIGWGQEMRGQAALVREAAKCDYELRFLD